jgi:hypothetical protein
MPVILGYEDVSDILPREWLIKEGYPQRNNFNGKYREYRQKCKLNFKCEKCKNSWSSMKGSCFFILWTTTGYNKRNNMYIEIYNQQCKRCKTWSVSDFYPDEFQSLLEYVIYKYNNPRKNKNIHRKSGNPQKNHESRLCEACRLGVCSIIQDSTK